MNVYILTWEPEGHCRHWFCTAIRPVSTTHVSVYPPSKVSTRMMNLMTGYMVTWRTCVCVCVCMCVYVCILCLYSVCNRFLCKWLDAWSSPMLFAYDPVYNVCIVMRWEVILPRHAGVESSKVTCYQLHTHTHPMMTSMHVRQAYRLDLNFGLSMHSMKSTPAWKKISYCVMFEDSGYTCNRPEKVTCTRARNMDFQNRTNSNSALLILHWWLVF